MQRLFQSTLPVRGATSGAALLYLQSFYFNPRSPCGERHIQYADRPPYTLHFNPRSPCGERPYFFVSFERPRTFQSTLPVRGATTERKLLIRSVSISIHAPRAGSDRMYLDYTYMLKDFNPRSPCGERRGSAYLSQEMGEFQSTLPVRGATQRRWEQAIEGTVFQSTLPVRGATSITGQFAHSSMISIHAPRAGSDKTHVKGNSPQPPISIHAPRAGSDVSNECCMVTSF